MFKKLLKKEKGFTIIEVMIVLAIAGLIMVVVLIAVPQLQRGQRNNATTAVLDRTFTEIQNYGSNNNGNYPNDTTELGLFCERYLEKTTCNDETGAAFLNDPRTGTPVRIALVTSGTAAPGAIPTDGTSRTITLYSGSGSGYSCDGEVATTGSGARSIAAVIGLEGGAFVCRDNK
jgi:prepilin-type N-terminal cleavage/methylation domain-containing protein